MSNHPRRYNLSEFRERKMDEGAIVIVTDDGKEWTIPPAELWPDEAATAFRRGPEAVARAILTDEVFDDFVKSGGTARLIDAILEDAQGATAGE